MFQIALGGYKNIGTNQTVMDDDPVFYEPGFNIMTPIEMGIPPADQISILVRQRQNFIGALFPLLSTGNFVIIVTDPTTGNVIPSALWKNSPLAPFYRIAWNGIGTAFMIVITNSVDVVSLPTRVRVLDCVLRNTTTNVFISFRLIVEDTNVIFNYVVVDLNNISKRFKFTSQGSQTIADLDSNGIANINTNGDSYIIFSPFSYLKEVDENESDFSFPLGSVFYQRQKTYNEEDFDFIIETYSHSFVKDNITLVNIPGYKKAAVVLVDKHLHTDILTTADRVYIDIKVTGVLSEVNGLFRIFFTR